MHTCKITFFRMIAEHIFLFFTIRFYHDVDGSGGVVLNFIRFITITIPAFIRASP